MLSALRSERFDRRRQIALLDEVGLDVASKASGVLHAAFGERLAPVPALDLKQQAFPDILGAYSGRIERLNYAQTLLNLFWRR